ncbi:odorant receptor [Trichonephila clavipes]|nr:odorant receptor [Trichonephila clavipes]
MVIRNALLDLNSLLLLEDRHVTRMTLMDHAATSQVPSRELGLFARHKCLNSSTTFAAAWTLSSTMAVATLDAASQANVFNDLQDGRIRVRWRQGEGTLAACVCHRHTGLSPDMMLWGAIGYTSRSPLVRIDGTLNSACYISGVLHPWFYASFESCKTLCLSRVMHSRMLLVLYLPSLHLDYHHMSVTTFDELWYRVEAAWPSVPVQAIQSLFDPMPRRISVMTARDQMSSATSHFKENSIVKITIHYCDLKPEKLLVQPIVCMHVVDSIHGSYVKKQDRERAVASFYETQRNDIDYIMPILTQPCTNVGKREEFFLKTRIIKKKYYYEVNGKRPLNCNAHPSQDADLALMTDASDFGLGASLNEITSDGFKPLGFFSKKLTPAQTKCSPFDRELLSAYSAIKYFRHRIEESESDIGNEDNDNVIVEDIANEDEILTHQELLPIINKV